MLYDGNIPTAAASLSKKRRTASKKLESAVERELKSLAMPHARFTIAWKDVVPGRASGVDHAGVADFGKSG